VCSSIAIALGVVQNVGGHETPSGLVFVRPYGEAIAKFGFAELRRAHLEAIGLKQERPQLFTTNTEGHRIRVRGLRGTGATHSSSAGRSDSTIAHRTGAPVERDDCALQADGSQLREARVGPSGPAHRSIRELAQLINQSTRTGSANPGCSTECAANGFRH
jgi:hypothetical protein